MYNRIYQLEDDLYSSIFLFGARQTGKSTLLRNRLKDCVIIDLLDSRLKRRFIKNPESLYDMLKGQAEGSVAVIDEIAEVPELLNEVHRLISEKGLKFVLCGSSARKLKRKGYNTLGGRALPCFFYPLVSAEIPDFDLDRALISGMLPMHYQSKNPGRLLEAYIDVYLKEEIQQEALTRHLDGFHRFLEVAAITNGEIVNYTNIATDCGVSASTVKEYFGILQDTLIGYMIPAYRKVVKRKLIQAPKFYYFDVGLTSHLLGRTNLVPGTPEYGHALESLIVQEIIAYLGYNHKRQELSYWHTYAGNEVDVVIGDAEVAIEIKCSEEIRNKHLVGLKAFREEHPDCRTILVSKDIIQCNRDGIECMYVLDFLKALWAGTIITHNQ